MRLTHAEANRLAADELLGSAAALQGETWERARKAESRVASLEGALREAWSVAVEVDMARARGRQSLEPELSRLLGTLFDAHAAHGEGGPG